MENVIITTINTPTFLEGICKNLKRFKYGKNENSIIVIGDLKTRKQQIIFVKNYQANMVTKLIILILHFRILFLKKNTKVFIIFFH